MPDEIEVHERITRLEEWSEHADRRMDQLAYITDGLVRSMRWVTIALAVVAVLSLGEKILPILTVLAGR